MHNIQIDSEFQALIPPLSAEERAQLEANLLADGCRDPLVVWPCATFEVLLCTGETQTLIYEDRRYELAAVDGEAGCDAWQLDADVHEDVADHLFGDMLYVDDWPHILIDGHNRYEICTRHGLPFDVVKKSFDSRPQARIWIRANQYGRRNLSSFVRAELALGDKADIALMASAKQAHGMTAPGVTLSPTLAKALPIDTREEVSKRAGISHGSLDKVEAIKAANPEPEILEAVRAGDVSINLTAQFVALPEEVQQEAIAAIAEHHEPAKEVMREAVHNHRAQGTGENEWYTPQEHIDAAYKVLGSIDLDPASSEIANQRVQAGRIFTIADDGLTKEWGGKVWMNPTACTCGVHPKLIESPDEYQNLPELSAGLAEHIRLLLGADGNSAPVLMVQGLQPREGKASTSSAAQIRNRENQAPGRKSQIRPEREGQACEAKAVGDGQPQAPIPSDCGPISVDDGALGASEGGMGPCLRILRGDDGTIDTGSFHSFVTSCVSGDIAKKYGSGLPELQFQQGGSDAGRLAYGQAAHCPNCRLVGYAVDKPSRVFMNPPYAQPHIANFIEKLASEYEAGRVTEAIALTHNYTDTQWFHRAALSCAAICFTRGRIGFLSPEGKRAAPTQGQAFFYYGSKVSDFIEAFCRIGFVVVVRNA